MAIKIGGVQVIGDDRSASFNILGLASYNKNQLASLQGTAVGDGVYNSDTNELVFWTGTKWTGVVPITTGGLTWTANQYKYHMFDGPGTFTTDYPVDVEVLVIAGGGGGGAGRQGGGGGAGGLQIKSVPVSVGGVSVTVGDGGAGAIRWVAYSNGDPSSNGGIPGQPSSFGSVTSTGGGGGRLSGAPGGSGGGSETGGSNGGSGIPGQGFPGGTIGSWPGAENGITGSGGGGAMSKGDDASGTSPGAGGLGASVADLASMSTLYPGVPWVFPSATTYDVNVNQEGFAGGGSGHGGTQPSNPGTRNPQGIGGGGFGRYPGGGAAGSYGAGGGGGGFRNDDNSAGGAGYKGLVVARYLYGNPPSDPTPPSIISQDGLLVNLDAGDSLSYPGMGTIWSDLSGNNNDAILVGSPSYTADPGYFDIISDNTYALLGSYSHGTNDFTYTMWVKFDAFDGNDTLFENGSWTDTLLFRVENTTTINVYAESVLAGSFSWNPSVGIWYNIVYTRSGSTNTLYVNGTQSGSTFTNQANISISNANTLLMRAQFTTGQSTNGQMAQYAMYNRALTSTEVQSNFDVLKGRYGY